MIDCLFNHARTRSLDKSVLSNEVKSFHSRKQGWSCTGLEHTTDCNRTVTRLTFKGYGIGPGK